MKKHFCSFCGKESEEVAFLVNGPSVLICNECVALCQEIISTHRKETIMPTDEQIHEIATLAAGAAKHIATYITDESSRLEPGRAAEIVVDAYLAAVKKLSASEAAKSAS